MLGKMFTHFPLNDMVIQTNNVIGVNVPFFPMTSYLGQAWPINNVKVSRNEKSMLGKIFTHFPLNDTVLQTIC